MFLWLALVFLKMHLKDGDLRWHRDLRLPEGNISQLYAWHEFFDIHAMLRAPYTGASLDPTAGGSFFVFDMVGDGEPYDYGDNYVAKTAFMSLEHFGMVASFTDGGAATRVLQDMMSRISGPVSAMQLREIMARVTAISLGLKRRPRFISKFINGTYTIAAEQPYMVEYEGLPREVFGLLMEHVFHGPLEAMRTHQDTETLRANIRSGNWTFLFDLEGKFLAHGRPTAGP